MDSKISYLKADDDKIINEHSILWVKKMNNCLEICNRSSGCYVKGDIHQICKDKSPLSFKYLDKHFAPSNPYEK